MTKCEATCVFQVCGTNALPCETLERGNPPPVRAHTHKGEAENEEQEEDNAN